MDEGEINFSFESRNMDFDLALLGGMD